MGSVTFAARPALSFAASGVVWAGGFFTFQPEMSALVPAIGYLVAGVVLIGLGHEHLPQVLAVLWFAAIALLLVILIRTTDPPSGWFLALVVSLVYGSAAFIGWVGLGGAIWALVKDESPRI